MEGELKDLTDELARACKTIDGEEVAKMMQDAEKGVDFWIDDEVFEDAPEVCVETADNGEENQRS